MKVFQMRPDPDHYQAFLNKDRGDVMKMHLLQCSPMLATWIPPSIYVPNPKLPKGDFYNANQTILITSPRATDVLHEHLEQAGELLPLPYCDQVFTLLNVVPCIDTLDHRDSEFRYGQRSGVRLGIMRYVFHADRFPNTSLFKIPESSEIYVVEGANDFAREFREAVTAADLKGISFREIWNNEPEFRGTPWNIRDYLYWPEMR